MTFCDWYLIGLVAYAVLLGGVGAPLMAWLGRSGRWDW